MDDVGVDWIKDHPDINNVARRCHPAFPLSELLDQSWDPKHVHFFITAKETVKDAEERDDVPELPLQTMHRRESQVSTPPLQALNSLRFPRGESTITQAGPASNSCRRCAPRPDLPPSFSGVLR